MNLGALFLAIVMVESHGDPCAIGDHGLAYGPAQIRQAALTEYNTWAGSNHKLQDCMDLELSRQVFLFYTAKYCTAQRLGRKPTLQDAARIWNGGPAGWKKPATIKYWRKVNIKLRGSNGNQSKPH